MNISCLPNKTLREVFCWTVAWNEYGNTDQLTYGFLSISHCWHVIALNTLELWSLWGPTIGMWEHWSALDRAGLVDLFLRHETWWYCPLDPNLCRVLQRCTIQGDIRRIDFTAPVHLITAVLSLITNGGSLPTNQSVYGFLSVCHCWHVVTLNTPEL